MKPPPDPRNLTVSVETASLAGTLELQLRLLRELSRDLVACRTAFVGMNLEAMYRHIATQAALCDEIRQIEDERKVAWHAATVKLGLDPARTHISQLIARLDPEVAARVRQVVTELALTEGELRHLNRAHTVLVDGSRRTLGILANVLASFSPTYARPNPAPAPPAASPEASATSANGGKS